MFKSLSEKRIFSYYLKGSDYTVSNLGRKLKRNALTEDLPLAVIEKRISEEKMLIKVNKIGKKNMVIGCGVLK